MDEASSKKSSWVPHRETPALPGMLIALQQTQFHLHHPSRVRQPGAQAPVAFLISLHFPALRGRLLVMKASLSCRLHREGMWFATSGALLGVRTWKVLHKQVLSQLLSMCPELSRLRTEPALPDGWGVRAGKVARPLEHTGVGGNAEGGTFSSSLVL